MVITETDEGLNFHSFDISALTDGLNSIEVIIEDEHGVLTSEMIFI